jgi:hypothetical protein
MNHRFLQSEAARFRAMAEESDRETTKLRLLAMAADYEAKAGVVGHATESDVAPVMEVQAIAPVEENPEKPTKLRLGGRVTRGLKRSLTD